jgi:hypothetical protein
LILANGNQEFSSEILFFYRTLEAERGVAAILD